MAEIMDVSRWQGNIDWNKVKASGKIDGVMLRVLGSKGGKSYVDPAFERNYAACTARGIPVGGYYYTCATTPQQTAAELAALQAAQADADALNVDQAYRLTLLELGITE